MELSVAEAARIAGVSARTAQRALADGNLGIARVLGRQATTDDLAVQAWIRTTGRGRTWADRTRDAALDLLSGGQGGAVGPSERSRLRSSLRGMSARQIAASSWTGTWARYRVLGAVDVSPIGPSSVDPASLGIVAGQSWMRFGQVADLDAFELAQPVTGDPDGDLVVVERPLDERTARQLVDAYVLGGARESAAAARLLEEAAHAL